ncbi:MAG: FIST C-terminal domain-containing protein [Deltaproteobacteria bacterium]|nr:FIST C-terminal domain-containing protein [Deltaproteobacteria bacterium]
MLKFSSASVRIVNSERAMAECLDIAFPDGPPKEAAVFIINSALGHKLDKLGAAIKKLSPQAVTLGCSASGVIGREGVGESMSDVALMAITGPPNEWGVAGVQDIYGHNAYEKGLELAKGLKAKIASPRAIYLLCPGIDIANDLVLKALIETFGEDINIFGGTSSDNMRGLINYQLYEGQFGEHIAWAVALGDPTLKAVTRATHGFTAYGQPLTVTKAEGHLIREFDGRPAWAEYASRLSLPATSLCGDTIPVGALAEKLPDDLAVEYGNPHILRVITKYDPDGTVYYPVLAKAGLEVWLTSRDEELIFSEQRRSLEWICAQMNGRKPVAVFQTDCLARGRFLFNKVVKDEIIAMMHSYLNDENGQTPPWLGMYGFGEYAKLGGRNVYHNYSTALLTLYRD